VGFVHVSPARDDDLDPERTGAITAIYLISQAWGRGLGRQLMTGALAALSEADCCEAALWVLDTNERARSFYRAGGWRPDGTARQEELPGTGTGVTLSEVRYRRPLP
jgi:ribosomal protein S18 acetylase RimI-like enzyme